MIVIKRWAGYIREALNADTLETAMTALEKSPVYEELQIEAPTIVNVGTAFQRLSWTYSWRKQ